MSTTNSPDESAKPAIPKRSKAQATLDAIAAKEIALAQRRVAALAALAQETRAAELIRGQTALLEFFREKEPAEIDAIFAMVIPSDAALEKISSVLNLAGILKSEALAKHAARMTDRADASASVVQKDDDAPATTMASPNGDESASVTSVSSTTEPPPPATEFEEVS